jgi:TP901 family phage tail tape measure protein
MYDLRLDADVTGHKNVVELADAVAKLAKNLPQLASSLGLLKSVGDIKGLDKAALAISSLNASVAGADPARVKEMAAATNSLANALAKLGAQKIPKGLDLGTANTGGFKQAAEMRAMVETMASSNQAIATSLTELSGSIRSGYAKATKEAQEGADKLKQAKDKADRDSAHGAKARITQLQKEYEDEVAAQRRFRREELQVIKEAGVSLIPEHRLQTVGMDSVNKRRVDDFQTGRMPTSTPAVDPLAEADKVLQAGKQWEKSAQEQAKARAFMLDERAQAVAKAKQLDSIAAEAESQNLAAAEARAKAEIRNQKAVLRARQEQAQALADLQQSSAKANASYSLKSLPEQLGVQISARSALDQGVNTPDVVSKFGSMATLAAKQAESLGSLRQRLEQLDAAAASSTAFEKMREKSAAMAGRVSDDLARMREQIVSANAAYATLGDQGKVKSQIGQQIGAANYLAQGRTEQETAAKFGEQAVAAAKAAESMQALRNAYAAATNSSKEGAKAADDQTAELVKQAAAVDELARHQREAALAANNIRGVQKMDAQRAQNTLQAKGMLESGKSLPEVQARFGMDVGTAAATRGWSELATAAEHATQSIAGAPARLKGAAGALADLHSAARGAASGFGAMWLTWGQVAPLLAGAALSNALVQTVKVGADINHQLQIMRALSGETENSIASLKAEIFSLSGGAVGIHDVAEAAKSLSLAGYNAQQTTQALGDVINLSIAGTADLKTSADTLVSVGTAFGYQANQLGRVGDVIAKSAAMSMAGVEDMAAAFRYSTAIAEQYGVSLEDVATSLASLAQRGIKGTSAGTATRQMFQEFTGTTAKTAKLLKELKIDAFDGMSGKLKPLLQLMHELEGSMDKLSGTGKTKKIGDIFNERASKDTIALRQDYLTSVAELDNKAAADKKAGKTDTKSGKQVIGELVSLQAKGDIEGYADALKKLSEAGAISEKGLLGLQHQVYNTSAGFSALARASMDTSTQNMMKAVTNTMVTSFAKAFESIDGAVAVTSVKLREIFASPEFKQGIVDLASAAANLGTVLVNNIGPLTTLLKLWLSWKVATITAAGMGAVITGFNSMAVGATAAAAKLPLAAAASTSMAVAANAVGVAAPRAAAGIALVGTAATRAMAVLGPVGVALSTVGALWALFWRGGVANSTEADGAEAKLKVYKDSLDEQLKRLTQINEAKAKGLTIDQLQTEEALTQAEMQTRTVRDAKVKGIVEQQGPLRQMIDSKLGDGASYDLQGLNSSQLEAARKALRASGKDFPGLTEALDQLRGGSKAIQAAIDQYNTDEAEIAAKRAGIMEQARKIQLAQMQDQKDARSKAKGQGGEAAVSEGPAHQQFQSFNALDKEFKDRNALIEKAGKEAEELTQAKMKAQLITEDYGNAEIATIEQRTYAQRAANYEAYLAKVQEISTQLEHALKIDLKGNDPKLKIQAGKDLEAMRASLASARQELGHMGDMQQVKVVKEQPLPKSVHDVDTFIKGEQERIDSLQTANALKLKSVNLSDEELNKQLALLKVADDYAKYFSPINQDLAVTNKALDEARSQLDSLASTGFEGFQLDTVVTQVQVLERRLKQLTAARDKLVAGQAATEGSVLSDEVNTRVINDIKTKIAELKSERDRIVSSFDTMMRSSVHDLFNGGFSWRKFGEAFSKTMKDALADAFYDAVVKAPVKAFAAKVAEGIRPSDKSGKPTDLLDGFSTKLSDWWNGQKPSTNTADDWMTAGLGAAQKSQTNGMKDQLTEAWDKGVAYFKSTDWGSIWDKVTNAFNKVDWAGMWDMVKSMFSSGKPGDGPSWTDTLGGLIGIGSKSGGSTGGSSGGAYDTGMNAELGLANGGAFFGNSTRAFANGGTFSNSILTTPTYFRYGLGSSLGVAGEAGPEAVMPLGRDGRGRLGVRMQGGGGGGGGRTVVQHTTNLTYNLGGGVTRSDLASYGAKIVSSAENRVADATKRGDQRFAK